MLEEDAEGTGRGMQGREFVGRATDFEYLEKRFCLQLFHQVSQLDLWNRA